jgi:hypothetical protein
MFMRYRGIGIGHKLSSESSAGTASTSILAATRLSKPSEQFCGPDVLMHDDPSDLDVLNGSENAVGVDSEAAEDLCRDYETEDESDDDDDGEDDVDDLYAAF